MKKYLLPRPRHATGGAGAFGTAPEVEREAAPERAGREPGDLGGAVLVDCTNPIAPGMAGLAVGGGDSGAERLARAAVGATYPDGRLLMPLCGDDDEAKATVAELAETLGFDAVDCGPLESARYLEPLAMLWITLAHRMGLGRDIGFALLRR